MEIQNKLAEIEKVNQFLSVAEDSRKTNPSKAQEVCCDAINLANEIGFKAGLAKAYLLYGIICRQTSDYERAFQNCYKAKDVYCELGDLKGQSRSLNSIANIHYDLSNYNKAISDFDACIELLDKLDDKRFKAVVTTNKGLSYAESGDIDKALACYYESMDIYDELKVKLPYPLLNNIGLAYQKLGDFKTSLLYLTDALKSEIDANNIPDQSFTLANIGLNYLYIFDYANSITYLTESLILMRKLGNVQAESRVFKDLSKAYSNMKCYPEALKYGLRAMHYVKQTGDKSTFAEIMNQLGQIYMNLKDFVNARKYFIESLETSISIGDKVNETNNYINLAWLYYAFQDADSVLTYLNKAIRPAEERNSITHLHEIYYLFSKTCQTSGRYSEATQYAEKKYLYEKKILELGENNGFRQLSMAMESIKQNGQKTGKEKYNFVYN
ncbi:MAG: tetratricopeptide repeat protein [Ignavibacteriae bacterium]|nr:MAG: tetratricopeptide repeat protein [Ignavibacteriota bacterium]